ncbi:hypothetical protein GCM10009744_02470 [Kribbella alba]|uniref:Uncharacterized protein n=1 Tax=Kribbella alba TaxID=190197 RepID=A0ABN2EVG9_9ACTN
MPSAAVTSPTSLTVACIAQCIARADSRLDPGKAARRFEETGNRAEHQPPFRPEAPNPAVSASRTTIRSVGSAFAR